jgi:putative DNA primase/helicase
MEIDVEYIAEVNRLAALPTAAYDQTRKEVAKKLGIRVSTLDNEVRAARVATAGEPDRRVVLSEVEPWPEPVEGGALLAEVAAAIRRHVILPRAGEVCVALWIAHTWTYEQFQHTPRLSITSPAKKCGKSTLIDVLQATCRRSVKADNISASAVFRTVEALRPLSLLIDETDAHLRGYEELRGVLNSGFEQSGAVMRIAEINGQYQPVQFATFAPVALAGIGKLPGTLEDRAIPIALQRKSATERVAKLRTKGARAALQDLARKLARWAADRGDALPEDPAVPDAMGDREGDICVPLLAIADDAGGAWPARAREALLELFGRRTATEDNMEAQVLLLGDLRRLFDEKGPRIPTVTLLDELVRMEERPWSEWRQARPMTPPQLAQVLKPFGARPRSQRVGAERGWGYDRKDFEDAWERYLGT